MGQRRDTNGSAFFEDRRVRLVRYVNQNYLSFLSENNVQDSLLTTGSNTAIVSSTNECGISTIRAREHTSGALPHKITLYSSSVSAPHSSAAAADGSVGANLCGAFIPHLPNSRKKPEGRHRKTIVTGSISSQLSGARVFYSSRAYPRYLGKNFTFIEKG